MSVAYRPPGPGPAGPPASSPPSPIFMQAPHPPNAVEQLHRGGARRRRTRRCECMSSMSSYSGPEQKIAAAAPARASRARARTCSPKTRSRSRRDVSRLRLDGPKGPIERDALVEPLQVDDERVGALILFPDGDVLDSVDTLLVEAVRFALSVQLLRHVVRFRSESATWSDLFERLFEGNWRDESEILNRASRLDFDPARSTRLIAVSTRQDRDAKGGAGPSLDVHQATARLGERVLGSMAVVVHRGDMIVVVPREHGPKSGNLNQFVRELGWLLHRPPALTMSDPCRRLDDYPTARRQCERLLRLAETLGVTGVVSERDFGPLAALISTAEKKAIRKFLDAQVGPILDHDRRHRMSLLETLKAFVEHEGRYQASADSLGIHVTTLRYRLQRLDELAGIDLTDRARRFDMHLAVRLHELIEAAE